MKKTKPVARPHHPPERGQEGPGVAGKRSADERPFWRHKGLSEMTAAEWESLCDGCGRCCLNKVEEEESGRIYYTDVGCKLLDGRTCRCKDYANRSDLVSDCVRLTPEAVTEIKWLPPTCGYRLVAEGRDLYWWHPLVSGDPDTVHTAGVSVQGRVSLTEDKLGEDDDYEDHIVSWPLRLPAGAKRRR
jgi:uncharacterized cysteine cluster protein YcgN (CxxCxxCC family)